MQSPFYMKTHYTLARTYRGHKFGGWASRAARVASRQGDAPKWRRGRPISPPRRWKEDQAAVGTYANVQPLQFVLVVCPARCITPWKRPRRGDFIARAAKRESAAVLLLNYDPLGTKRIMQVADNFFAALFAGTPGLDGRDGIPGEPGLDGIPGEFKTHIWPKIMKWPSVIILFDSQAETAWTASLESMERLVCKIGIPSSYQTVWLILVKKTKIFKVDQTYFIILLTWQSFRSWNFWAFSQLRLKFLVQKSTSKNG